MSVVDVDNRGRFTIPKDIGVRGGRAVVISAGAFFVVIPIKGDPYTLAAGWLRTNNDTEELEEEAEIMASEDASARSGRRK